METKMLTCVVCPMGCRMEAVADGNKIKSLKGNTCKRGESYAQSELFDPRRTLTTTVAVAGGNSPLVAVKSANPLPKVLLTSCMEVLRRTRATAPVASGQTLVEDILGTGIDIVACDDVDAKELTAR